MMDGHIPEDEQEPPTNKDPMIITWAIGAVVETIQSYGWFILLGVVAAYFLYQKLKPNISQWQDRREQDSYKKMDSGKALERMEGLEKARQRMQAQMDEKAMVFAEKQEQREAEKRQERLEDWDRHQQGRGYRSKTKASDEVPARKQSSSASKPQAKKSLRSDYSPLMGDTGGAGFRPTRRGGASGGG